MGESTIEFVWDPHESTNPMIDLLNLPKKKKKKKNGLNNDV
jgi:hypothetical protein